MEDERQFPFWDEPPRRAIVGGINDDDAVLPQRRKPTCNKDDDPLPARPVLVKGPAVDRKDDPRFPCSCNDLMEKRRGSTDAAGL